ncbi:MAG TPA: DUF6036 family nucleotidyltransferase [Arenimonas sp.]|nr:DUF6036 family nucleotidyltransferase [Arenimonas sp.]
MPPDRLPPIDAAWREAVAEMVRRIAGSLAGAPRERLPVRMYIAGGAALHFHTGARISMDVDASFSHRFALPEDLEVSFPGEDGAARLVYFDHNYNDSFALMHEQAHDDALPLELPGVDRAVLDVRVLSPLDLAVSKLARFGSQDREDIATLARAGLIDARALRRRAEEALASYVGDVGKLRNSIDIACRIVDSNSVRA